MSVTTFTVRVVAHRVRVDYEVPYGRREGLKVGLSESVRASARLQLKINVRSTRPPENFALYFASLFMQMHPLRVAPRQYNGA